TVLELDRALVGLPGLFQLANGLSGPAEPTPVPAPSRRELDVMAKVAVRLVIAAELEERVAKREVRHRIACLETGAPEFERVLSLLGRGRVEVDPVHGGLPAEVRARR